ncbi:MAG: hypothetical protein LBV73_05950 [Paraburkholderia sp.]|jgi:hypothetical protein|nr:hypothetical protein [Paraburkholderia sp.]
MTVEVHTVPDGFLYCPREVIANAPHLMNVTDPERVNASLRASLAEASAANTAATTGERHG